MVVVVVMIVRVAGEDALIYSPRTLCHIPNPVAAAARQGIYTGGRSRVLQGSKWVIALCLMKGPKYKGHVKGHMYTTPVVN